MGTILEQTIHYMSYKFMPKWLVYDLYSPRFLDSCRSGSSAEELNCDIFEAMDKGGWLYCAGSGPGMHAADAICEACYQHQRSIWDRTPGSKAVVVIISESGELSKLDELAETGELSRPGELLGLAGYVPPPEHLVSSLNEEVYANRQRLSVLSRIAKYKDLRICKDISMWFHMDQTYLLTLRVRPPAGQIRVDRDRMQ